MPLAILLETPPPPPVPLSVLELPFAKHMVTATSLHDLHAIEKLREEELEEARIIQGAMLPSQPLHAPDILISHEFQPVAGVGGDFLDYFSLTDGTIGIVPGRCFRKGTAGGAVWRPCDRNTAWNSQNGATA